MLTRVSLFIGLFLYSKRLIFYPVFVVSSTPEVFIHNGHFSWRQQEETDEEEEGVFSTAGELTNIDLHVDTVRTPLCIQYLTQTAGFCIYGS